MMNARNRPPFTATQWQELENQALIFKHMVSGVPIPPELLFPLKRSWDSSVSSKLFPHQSMGWGCFHMGLGRKIDPEPGRCRRTDGKKWRCSKEAFPDSKYCEKHMHRGRNRSRKPVEVITTNQQKPISSFSTTTSSTTTTNPSFSLSSSMNPESHHHHHHHPYYNNTPLPSFLYPHSSSSKPPGFGFSPQTNTPHFASDSGSYSQAENDYRNRCVHGVKEGLDERSFFSEPSGSLRSVPDLSLDNSWKFTPLRMSSSTLTQPKETNCYSVLQNGYSQAQFSDISEHQNKHQQQEQHCFVLGTDFKSERPVKVEKAEEPQQPLRHFFDEWPLKNRESWMNLEEERLNRASFSTTQLSISIPEPSSDFAASSYSSTRSDG